MESCKCGELLQYWTETCALLFFKDNGLYLRKHRLVNLTLTCSKCLEQINKEFVSTYSIIPRNHNRFYTTKQSNLYVIVSKEEMLCDSQVEKKKIWGINWLSNSKSFRYMVHRGRCFYIRTYATQINY